MNIFFRFGSEVVTSPLTGTILPGVTRDSTIKPLQQWGVPVVERRFTIDEVIAAQQDGSLQEVFGTGTAAIISPVGTIHYRGRDYKVADGQVGEISRRLYDQLLGMQYGEREDPFGWVERID